MSDKPVRHTVDDVYRMQWIGWIITVLLIVAAAYAGVQLPPLPPMPAAEALPTAEPIISSRGVTNLDSLALDGSLLIAAPTAAATATPALVVDSLGAGNNLLEVRKAATPVFSISNAGVVAGNVLQFSTSGSRAIAWTDDITGTATVAHGLSTVTWAVCTLGEDPTAGAGDAAHVTVAISENVVTCKVWQDDFVTEATETDVTAHCLVIGAP